MSGDAQEYIYNGEFVRIVARVDGEINGSDGYVVVQNDDGHTYTAHKSSLTRKEESYSYRRAIERQKELEAITASAKANFDELASRVAEEAISRIRSTMLLNTLFAKTQDEGLNATALVIVNALVKVAKELAPEKMKENTRDQAGGAA